MGWMHKATVNQPRSSPSWLANAPTYSCRRPNRLIIIAFALTLVKSGLRITSNLDTFRASVPDFFENPHYWRSSIVIPLFSTAFRLNTEMSWIIGYGVVTIFLLLGPPIFYWTTRNPHNLFVCIAVLISQIPVIALTEIGRFDVFALVGSLMVGLSSGNGLFFIGALLISIANYEHFVVIGAILLILSMSTNSLLSRKKVVVVFGSIGILVSVLHRFVFGEVLLFALDSETRGSWLIDNIDKFSIANFTSLPLLTYSAYGSVWIIVILSIATARDTKTAFVRFLALIAVPIFFTITTFDGTRVFVALSASALIVVLREFVRQSDLNETDLHAYSIVALLFAVLTPALNVEVLGQVKRPYLDIVLKTFGKVFNQL